MGSFSIWHWVILLVIVYAGWRLLPRRAPPTAVAAGPARAEAAVKATRLPSEGAKPLEVAGIQHYEEGLRAAISSKLKRYRSDLGDDDIDDGECVELEVVAALQFEDGNVHDQNAVMVRIGQRQVGYIPAKMAPLFRAFVKRKGLGGDLFSCAAEVEVEVKSGEPVSMVLMLPPLKP